MSVNRENVAAIQVGPEIFATNYLVMPDVPVTDSARMGRVSARRAGMADIALCVSIIASILFHVVTICTGNIGKVLELELRCNTWHSALAQFPRRDFFIPSSHKTNSVFTTPL